MELQRYRKKINSEIMHPIRRNIIRDKLIEDGSYFNHAVKRSGVLNKDRVLSSNSYQPSNYGEDFEGRYDPVSEALDERFNHKNNRNIRGGKFNLVNSIKDIGHKIGEPFSIATQPLGFKANPFDLGYTIGHDYVSPYIVDPIKNKIKGGRIKHHYETNYDSDSNSECDYKGGKFNFGKIFNNPITHKILDVGTNVAGKVAEKAITNYLGGDLPKGKKPKKKTKKQLEIELAVKLLKKHKQI